MDAMSVRFKFYQNNSTSTVLQCTISLIMFIQVIVFKL